MKKIFAVIVIALLLSACGGTKPPVNNGSAAQPVDCTPDWFMTPPKDNNYLYAAQEAKSPSLQTAVNIAQQNGLAAIATQIQTEVSNNAKSFTEQAGLAEDPQLTQFFSTANSSIANEVLVGAKPDKIEKCREGNVNTVYVLMKMPTGEMKMKLLEKMKAEQAMMAKFKSNGAFDKLEKEVEAYKASKS